MSSLESRGEGRRPPLPKGLSSCPVVTILRRLPAPTAELLVGALSEESLRVFEVTIDSTDALAVLARLVRTHPDLDIGVGTVRSVDDVQRAVDAGARFLVSPHTDSALIAYAVEQGIPYLPGALTATETLVAWRSGAAAVKLFPASVVGPGYLRALRDPLPDVDFIAVGGVGADNARSFLEAGAKAVGVGSWLGAGGDISLARRRANELVMSIAGTGEL